jgi:signal transduction histidine kinase
VSIRRRLTISFLTILVLFAVNQMVYRWGNEMRRVTVEALRSAIARQSLIASINQTLNDLQKQVTLLSQAATDQALSGAPAEDIAQFEEKLDVVRNEIAEVSGLADAEAMPRVAAFNNAYRDLSASWRIFYENFGVNQSKAITELAIRAEPLSQKVVQQLLPQLQQDEKTRVEAASAEFYRVAAITDRITLSIFLVSTVIAAVVAFVLSRSLGQGLFQLKEGAAKIGSGNLDYRIPARGHDELTELALSFNAMSENLLTARTQLTLVNQQEKHKSEELEKALQQLRQAQDQLVVQQKLASLGSLTAGIAHEIKNPLNFVNNFSDISVDLLSDLMEFYESQKEKLSPKDLAYIKEILNDLKTNITKIREHGKRADNIVKGMLLHSRGQGGELQPTNINEMVAEYLKLAYHGMRAQDPSFNVTLQESYDPTLSPVPVFPADLSRVLLNIANNACYAAFHSRRRNANEPTVSVLTKNLGGRCEIRIRDNGNGIPSAIREKVFEPFFTTKPAGSGTGLGLSLSYDIVVKQHKGELAIESEEGSYAEFIIRLPT